MFLSIPCNESLIIPTHIYHKRHELRKNSCIFAVEKRRHKSHTYYEKELLLSLAALLLLAACKKQDTDYPIDKAVYNRLPFKMEEVQLPSFPDYQVSITEFGAVPDGITLNTKAFNDAINHVYEKGGGTVVVPEGLWLTGPIEMRSNVNLYTEYNALVYFSEDHSLYPIIETSFEGLDTRRCQSPISAWYCENIAITGHGTFDGNGDTWRAVKKSKLTESQWNKLIKKGGIVDGTTWYPSEGSLKGKNACVDFNNPTGIETMEDWLSIRDWLRPVLLNFVKCKRVLIEGCTFKNSPAWCLHPRSCDHITLNKVTVVNPWYSQNGDALDLESCTNAIIANCHFDAGDDAICLKSGKNEDGRRRDEPCKNVIIQNNVVLHGHGGFVVGSEMSGGVQNIFVDNCTFMGTDVGLRFKSCRGRGGLVENIFISNINMINIPNEAIIFNLFYNGKSRAEVTYDEDGNMSGELVPISEETPIFRNIYIDNVTCKGAGRAIFFNGLPEMRIANINLDNIIITDAKEGAIFQESQDITINNLSIETTDGSPKVRMGGVKNVTVNGTNHTQIGKLQTIDL